MIAGFQLQERVAGLSKRHVARVDRDLERGVTALRDVDEIGNRDRDVPRTLTHVQMPAGVPLHLAMGPAFDRNDARHRRYVDARVVGIPELVLEGNVVRAGLVERDARIAGLGKVYSP